MFIHTLLFSLISFITGADSIGSAPKAELIFVGDAMQHQAQLDRARQLAGGKSYDYSGCFPLIAPAVSEADYAVCNLEVPLGGGPDYTGYPCFSAPDSYAQALADAGFDLFLTANNHCLDRRDKAARRTLKALDRIGVDHIGTYHDRADRDSLIPFIKDINGFKIGFLNYTYGTNGIQPNDGVEIALIDRDDISREIKKTKEAGAELLVVCMHWGIEYVLLENGVQRSLADFLVSEGVDMVIGGHPHVIQPMKVVRNEAEDKDVLIVYSLGNFISNMKTADTRGGAVVWATVTRDSDGKARFDHAEYDTVFAAKPSGSDGNFIVIPSWLESEIPAAQQAHWQLFRRGADKIFDKHNVNVPRRQKKRQ